MPLYDYECQHCNNLLEDVFQNVKDEPLKKCDSCGEEKLERIITGGIAGFVSGSNTIGSLADKNARVHKNMINENMHRKKESEPKEDKPWYHEHTTATNKEVSKMSKEQKARYIMEGKK